MLVGEVAGQTNNNARYANPFSPLPGMLSGKVCVASLAWMWRDGIYSELRRSQGNWDYVSRGDSEGLRRRLFSLVSPLALF